MLDVHSLVKASDEGYGEYIGEVIGARKFPAPIYYVKILACVKYPSQFALLIKTARFKREPYPFLSVQTFSATNVQIYYGQMPDYEHSIKDAYGQAQSLTKVPAVGA